MTEEVRASLARADIQPADPKITVHDFRDKILENTVHFQIIKLEDSFLVWIGSSPNLENLAMAISTQYSSTPLGTCLMGSTVDSVSTALAQKLARKTKKQVFASYNLPADYAVIPLVEKRLFEELKSNPDKF